MKKSLTRSIPYWILLLLSVASAAVGGWIISDNAATMTARLLDGTATGVEVYVGQPLIAVGGILLGAGVIGVLLALTVAAAKSLVPAAAPVVTDAIDWSAQADEVSETPTNSAHEESEPVADETVADEAVDEDDQNGSSGSTATATNISVR
ncbi:tetraspanin family protein [Microbacterium sp. AK031]|uniref:tetraspanin family protein n=1 Tax=Microbacterium sp. AK031 TaxID=2723076 RepID=UPI002168060E|nr:tetraspanin family protein [Microbacterium sp. AK031]MCS3842733.1 UPF0716 family protein affecting phage T7 exclusion [Microbacterium sp. AK031]